MRSATTLLGLNLLLLGPFWAYLLFMMPFRFEIYATNHTISVVTLCKRWNFERCSRAHWFVEGGLPAGVPFRPTIKYFCTGSENCLLIVRQGNDRDWHLTMSPQDPQTFIEVLSQLQPQEP